MLMINERGLDPYSPPESETVVCGIAFCQQVIHSLFFFLSPSFFIDALWTVIRIMRRQASPRAARDASWHSIHPVVIVIWQCYICTCTPFLLTTETASLPNGHLTKTQSLRYNDNSRQHTCDSAQRKELSPWSCAISYALSWTRIMM
jgi:hypothetical protein